MNRIKIPAIQSVRVSNNVLPSVVDTGATNTKASESSVNTYTCHVYGAVPDWIFPGEKTLYDMQSRISRRCVPHLLQWRWKLPVLGDV